MVGSGENSQLRLKRMDTLRRNLPISAPEGLDELQRIAVSFEEIYNAATSQADYLQKISTKMLTMEQENSNRTGSNVGPTNSNMPGQGSPDAAAQTTQAGADTQEEVYQKIKYLKEMYSPDIHEMHQKIASKLQQHEGLVLPPKQSEQLEGLKKYKMMIERIIHFLNVHKSNITAGLKDKLPVYEKQIVSIVTSNGKRQRQLKTWV